MLFEIINDKFRIKGMLVLAFITVLTQTTTVCQNTFQLQIPLPGYQTPGDIEIDNWGNYIVSAYSYDDNKDVVTGLLYKIDPYGEIVTSITLHVPDSGCYLTEIIELDSNYLIFGAIGPGTSTMSSIMICSFDFELNLQWRKQYKLSEQHIIGMFNAKIDHDGNIVAIGSAMKEVKYYDPDPFLFTCNQQGDSLSMVVEPYDYQQMLFDFLIKPDSSGYISFGYGQYPSYPSYHSFGAYYSPSFDFEKVIEIPDDRFHSSHTVRWINDHEFFISGKKHIAIQYEAYQGVGMKRMDTSFSITQEVDFGHILDTINYPGWERSFDYLNIDNIFFTWSKNYDDFFQFMPSWIVLTRLDSNLNIIYDRYYGGDAMYSSYFIDATEDGGCVILGIIYDYEGIDYDLYLIKTDENGLVTTVDEDHLQSKLNILVYPNPCSGRISFDHNLTRVDIYNHSGQLVLRFQNYNQFSDIAVGQLQSGVYIYRALSKEGGYASGKFVKR